MAYHLRMRQVLDGPRHACGAAGLAKVEWTLARSASLHSMPLTYGWPPLSLCHGPAGNADGMAFRGDREYHCVMGAFLRLLVDLAAAIATLACLAMLIGPLGNWGTTAVVTFAAVAGFFLYCYLDTRPSSRPKKKNHAK
jgi:hypothetical protein